MKFDGKNIFFQKVPAELSLSGYNIHYTRSAAGIMDIIPAQRNFRKFCENGAGITYIMERSTYARSSSCLIVMIFDRVQYSLVYALRLW